MKLQNSIYLAIAFVFLLLCFGFLGLYYTQEFKEEFNFKSQLSFDELDISSRSYNGADYIYNIQANLGEIILINKGYFTQIYHPPRVIGCVDFKPEAQTFLRGYNLEGNREIIIGISSTLGDINTYSPEEISVPVGKSRSLYINADYRISSWGGGVNGFPYDDFVSSVESVSFYQIKEKEDNPFILGGYSLVEEESCEFLELNQEPLKVIYFS